MDGFGRGFFTVSVQLSDKGPIFGPIFGERRIRGVDFFNTFFGVLACGGVVDDSVRVVAAYQAPILRPYLNPGRRTRKFELGEM